MSTANSEHSGQPRARSWATFLIWGSLALLVAATAMIVIRQATIMNDGMRPTIGTMGLSLPLFLLLWVPMMAAMMLLSVAPLATFVARMLATRPYAILEVSQLVVGYLGAWVLAGLPAYVVLLGFDAIIERAPGAAPWADAALLAVAGAYQWMPFKRMCLRHCRSPLAFVMQVAGMKGPFRGLRIGARHGLFCLGCCWALMLALLALGMMNVALMAVFAVAIFVEKTWRYGIVFSRAVGVILILLSVAILVHPEIVSGLPSNMGM
jgi:predicted metal-binding membrane protein